MHVLWWVGCSLVLWWVASALVLCGEWVVNGQSIDAVVGGWCISAVMVGQCCCASKHTTHQLLVANLRLKLSQWAMWYVSGCLFLQVAASTHFYLCILSLQCWHMLVYTSPQSTATFKRDKLREGGVGGNGQSEERQRRKGGKSWLVGWLGVSFCQSMTGGEPNDICYSLVWMPCKNITAAEMSNPGSFSCSSNVTLEHCYHRTHLAH